MKNWTIASELSLHRRVYRHNITGQLICPEDLLSLDGSERANQLIWAEELFGKDDVREVMDDFLDSISDLAVII